MLRTFAISLVAILLAALTSAAAQAPEGIQSKDVPETNGLHWFLLASELMPRGPAVQTVEDILDKGWRDDPAVLDLFKAAAPAVDAVRKGIEVGKVKFPDFGPEEPLPYLSQWRALARLMTAEAMRDTRRGSYGTAINLLANTIDFGCETSRDGILITYLVGHAIQETAARRLHGVLKSPRITIDQYRVLINRLKSADSRAPRLAGALAREADMLDFFLQQYKAAPEQLREKTASILANAGKKLPENPTAAQLLDWCQQTAKCAREIAQLSETPVYEFKPEALDPCIKINPLAQQQLDSWRYLPEAEARGKAIRRGALLIAAIEAYRLEHNAYPESLQDLSPSILTEIPNDPFTGAPFPYKRQANGYLLYSAGKNMRDDAGQGKPWTLRDLDYVMVNAGS